MEEQFTNATIVYTDYTDGTDIRYKFCTKDNFKEIYDRLKKCYWITDISVHKYNLS